jgi:ribosomal-protein-alanine N-acetyltransferase
MEAVFPFEKFPELITERLKLRKIGNEDVAGFFKLRSNPETMRFIPRPLATTEQDILDFINVGDEYYAKGDMINFTIALKETNEFVGSIGFYRTNWEAERTEVGYILDPEHRGKGYTHEAMVEMIRFAFNNIGFHSLEAIIDPRNTASINVVERVGFVKEGHLKESSYWNGEYIDCLIYSILNK